MRCKAQDQGLKTLRTYLESETKGLEVANEHLSAEIGSNVQRKSLKTHGFHAFMQLLLQLFNNAESGALLAPRHEPRRAINSNLRGFQSN